MIHCTEKEHIGIKNRLEDVVTNIILNADGSTTRLLETIVGGEATVQVHMQGFFLKENLPLEPTEYFKGGDNFLYRIVSLYYKGEPLSDNVVVAPEYALDLNLRQGIERGQVPLGKLIDQTEHRRKIISTSMMHSSEVKDLFFSFPLEENFFPVKKYRIIKDGQSWFYICEVFHYKTICKYLYANSGMDEVIGI